LNIRSVTYVALIVAGLGAGFVLPLAEMIGCSLTVLFLALFQPYFGWTKTLKINFVLYASMLPLLLPSLMGLNQVMSSMFPAVLDYAKTLPNTKPADLEFAVWFWNFLLGSPTYYVVELAGIFGQRIFMIAVVLRVLKKTGIYRVFNF
jgi:hypothetical protein